MFLSLLLTKLSTRASLQLLNFSMEETGWNAKTIVHSRG